MAPAPPWIAIATNSGSGPQLFQDGEFAPALERAPVRLARVDAPEVVHQFRPALIEPAASGGGFDREAHLDVGGAEVVAREPGAARELALHVIELAHEVRLDEVLLHLAGDAARDRAHEER